MSRKILIPLLAAMFLGAPIALSGAAQAFSKYLDQTTPLKTAKPMVGTTGRTSKFVKGSQNSPGHKNTIDENQSPMPQDR
jgi:hypothetical protein